MVTVTRGKVKVVRTKKPRIPGPTLIIEPTQEDIVQGTCDHPTKCMYALTLRRMFPTATYVSVNINCITITIGGMYYHYSIPSKAVRNIVDYDDTKKVDLSRAKVTAILSDSRVCNYQASDETREYHRLKTARRRASPDYVRPESKQTLRGMLAKKRRLERRSAAAPA